MSKAVMISIQPKWCELIASGKKTIEVRKTKPKLETPFKCYIYQTQGHYDDLSVSNTLPMWDKRQKVIGEFVCDCISEYECEFHDGICMYYEEISKVYIDEDGDKFSVIETANDEEYPDSCELLISAAMTFQQIKDYANWDGFGELYGWHISDLVIYDRPKELSEFLTTDNEAVRKCEHRFCGGQAEYKVKNGGWIKGSYMCTKKSDYDPDWCEKCKTKPITRPPQSWCYVEPLRE